MVSNLCLFRRKPEGQLEVLQRARLLEQADRSAAGTRTGAAFADVPRVRVLFLSAQRTQQLVVVKHLWRVQEPEHESQGMKKNLEVKIVMINGLRDSNPGPLKHIFVGSL